MNRDLIRKLGSDLKAILEYMHNLDIVHNDIRIENIVYNGERDCF